MHHATSTVSAVFDEHERLGAWLETITGMEGVSVQQLDWSLTESSRMAAETEALGAAVSDARRRAEAIASALGLLSLRTIAVSDPGLLSDSVGATIAASDVALPRMMKASAPASAEGIVLEPAELEIVILVHARFVAE
ncbi:MAG TPA: SIMPL domain-containing protein [Plantibacter sp.]|uniref:SIMPL domain-containing protein n=1 Tax=unclassified Plantibacter TaxID=2624265 RepID=UPI002B7FAB02|nr:SIMPL domain-containing protein [Plantibacter sp.]